MRDPCRTPSHMVILIPVGCRTYFRLYRRLCFYISTRTSKSLTLTGMKDKGLHLPTERK
ncbi:hypothetical protein M9458_027511, partial [Cirrhinus mrigala]